MNFEQVKLESVSEKGSYGIGLQIGQQLADSQMEITVEAVAKGIFDTLNHNQPALDINELMHSVQALQQQAAEAQQAQFKAIEEEGKKFLDRFDANSYLRLLRALDLYDPAFNYPNLNTALAKIKANYTLIAITSDQLFKLRDVQKSRQQLQDAGVNLTYHELNSNFGHDSFLVDYAFFEPLIKQALNR